MLNIVKDIDIINDIRKFDVILIGTNIINSLGNGFQKKMAINFPYIKDCNNESPYGDSRKLGTVRVIPAREGNPIFCLCYINKGRRRPDLQLDYLDYDALEKCLSLVNTHFNGKKIATTLIGGSKFDGDGDRDKILDIIQKHNDNIELSIYDYTQLDFNKEMSNDFNQVKSYLGTTEFIPHKKAYYWKMMCGELTPYPEGYEDMSFLQLKQYVKEKKQDR